MASESNLEFNTNVNRKIIKNNQNSFINNAFETDERAGIERKVVLEKNKSCLTETSQAMVIDFDDLLPYIGEFGKYQKILFLCMIPFAFFVAFVYFSQIFITLIPENHWCHIPELDHLNHSERLELSIPLQPIHGAHGYSKCEMFDVNYTQILIEGIKVANHSWPKTACKNGWDFEFSDIPYRTISTDLEWVCHNSALPIIAQSIFFIGAIVGGLIFGWIADRFGRIPALVSCNIIGFIAGMTTALSTSFWHFAICRFLVGFAFDNCFTMMYILVLEYVGPKWRTFVANMSIAIFFTLASCLLPWIAYFVGDWKNFAMITSAPLALAIFTPWLVPESARWLVSQGKIEEAIKILKKFEKINGKEISPDIYKNFSDSCARLKDEESSNNSYSVFDLFKTPRLRNITILLIVIWMIISLVFDGHVRNVGSLGIDLFLTFTVACATELPADTFLTLTLDRWGRRWLAFGTMVLSGIFSLLATTVPIGPYSATLAILGRFSVNISYNIGLQYAAELLPTVVRAQGVAFIHIMGYVATIVAPFVVYLSNIAQSLPLIILGVLGIIGGILSLFLPETLDHELPQTLTDGEEFGRGQRIWDIPCLNKKSIDDEITNNRNKNVEQFQRARQRTSIRASLSKGEMRSSILQRSRRSTNLNTYNNQKGLESI